MAPRDPSSLTPIEFEQFVRQVLDDEGVGLKDYQSHHLETIAATDGNYVFDVTARFTALGVDFLVLVECKRSKLPIEREEVLVLDRKRQSVHAQKAILFTTSSFRRGALEFAEANGVATAVIRSGSHAYRTRAEGPPPPGTPELSAWLDCLTSSGTMETSIGALDTPFGRDAAGGELLRYLAKGAEGASSSAEHLP